MIKKGIYCSLKQHVVEEEHGGVTLQHPYNNLLAFYYPDKFVGFYSGDRLWTKPFEDKSFRYFGEVTKSDDTHVVFFINDLPNNDIIFFTGSIVNNQINIVAKRKSAPHEIWLEDVFEFVGEG